MIFKKTGMAMIYCLSIFIYSAQERIPVYQDEQIEISQQKVDCERKDQGTHKQYYYLQFENLTDHPIELSFKRNLWYNNQCSACNSASPEYITTISLAPHEKIAGDCHDNSDKRYRIFSKMLNLTAKSVLTDFKLTDIKIREVE